jgi:Protein of unknown function (DUF2934)
MFSSFATDGSHQMSSENASTADSSDREERIRQRAYRLWEEAGRPEGTAQDHWHRAAQDLDREDAAIQREGIAGEKPGVKTGPTPEGEKPPSDRP